MDRETSRMVRDVTVDRLGPALRVSVVILALSLSVAALVAGWSLTTRATMVGVGPAPVVYRENLLTGEADFCALGGGIVRCFHAPKRGEIVRAGSDTVAAAQG